MSESSFPFGAPDEPVPTDTVEGEGTGDRSPKVLVGALVGALVLGASGFFLLGGGGAEDDSLGAPVQRAAVPAEVEAPAPAAAAAVPAASVEQVGRNPFKALYVEPKGGTGDDATGGSTDGTTAGTTDGTTSTGTTGGTTDGTTTGGTTGGTTGTTGGTTGEMTPMKTLTVELIKIEQASGAADFVVTKSGEKTPYAGVQLGHDFGDYFRYITAGYADNDPSVQCARILIGDALVDICQQDVHTVKAS